MAITTQDRLLCCDWGTSNFRLYLVDRVTGEVIARHNSTQGIADMNAVYQQQATYSRVDLYANYLHEQITLLGQGLSLDLADTPVMLSGMSSSSIGMIEVRYAQLPFSLVTPRLNHEKIIKAGDCRNELYVFGGLQSEDDMMRGEEVEVLGLSEILRGANGVCVLPGTHSKHVTILDQEVVGFKTYMTGEVFELLSTQSILKYSILQSTMITSDVSEAYAEGIREGADGNLLQSLFKVRSNDILREMKAADNYFYMSGLLIGQELASLRDGNEDIYLCGGSTLAPFYKLALEVLGLQSRVHLISADQMSRCIPIAHLSLFNNLMQNSTT